MNDIVVSAVGVIKLLKGLNPSKALGPDELHPRVLKELASELGPVFAHLFQQSIDTGEIPKEWSLANICPLFKKGDRSLACNYRPVSLTCVPCKLLEHIVCSNIMAHLDLAVLIFVEHIRKLTIKFICLLQFRFSNTITNGMDTSWLQIHSANEGTPPSGVIFLAHVDLMDLK